MAMIVLSPSLQLFPIAEAIRYSSQIDRDLRFLTRIGQIEQSSVIDYPSRFAFSDSGLQTNVGVLRWENHPSAILPWSTSPSRSIGSICVDRSLSDLVVVDDVTKLLNTSLGWWSVGAPEYCHANFTKYFTGRFWSDERYSATFSGRNPCYFNTGVMVMDLAKWRRAGIKKSIKN